MGITSALYSGVSGLNTNSQAMSVIGNNLAPREDALVTGIRAVADLLDSGRIDANRIDQSLARIALFKERIAGERLWQAIDPPTAG